MKVLICTQKVDMTDANLGFFHRWIEEFADRAKTVHVICLEEGVHALPQNVTVHSLGKETGARDRGSYIRRFLSLIRDLRGDYDSVFVHMNPEYVLLGGGLWRLWGKRIGLWYTHKSTHPYIRVAVHIAHVVYTASSESLRIATKKKVVMGHGIDTHMFQPAKGSKVVTDFTILTFGRLSKSKNLGPLITAVETLSGSDTPCRLIIAGGPVTVSDKSYARSLEELVRERGLSDRVEFRGPIPFPRVPALIHEADLFVNLSQTGSLDKAVLEAMATGVPVLTSNEGLRSTLVPEAGECFLDNDADLAGRIAEMVRLAPDEQRLIGAKLRAIVERDHSIHDLVERIMIGLG